MERPRGRRQTNAESPARCFHTRPPYGEGSHYQHHETHPQHNRGVCNRGRRTGLLQKSLLWTILDELPVPLVGHAPRQRPNDPLRVTPNILGAILATKKNLTRLRRVRGTYITRSKGPARPGRAGLPRKSPPIPPNRRSRATIPTTHARQRRPSRKHFPQSPPRLLSPTGTKNSLPPAGERNQPSNLPTASRHN